MIKIAISVGGSVIGELNLEYVKKLSTMLIKFSDKYKFYLVTGGGEIARRYIDACRAFGTDESYLDNVGIDATRLNAKVLIAALNDAYPEVAKDFDEALIAGKIFKFIVMGGTHPGHTTDAVTAMLAERINADKMIIMTNVKGVYTADPKKHKNAKFLKELSYDDLIDITMKTGMEAGSKGVIDPLAAKIIARARIETVVVNGRDIKNLANLLMGKKFIGSMIRK